MMIIYESIIQIIESNMISSYIRPLIFLLFSRRRSQKLVFCQFFPSLNLFILIRLLITIKFNSILMCYRICSICVYKPIIIINYFHYESIDFLISIIDDVYYNGFIIIFYYLKKSNNNVFVFSIRY